MTTLGETDTHLVKCIGYLHASTTLRKGDPVPLQYVLEEAIKNKYGVVKDYTELVQSCLKPREEEEFPPVVTTEESHPVVTIEESKASSSDNELELDLLKEDLMCIVCNGMDVGARNRLLECSDCHSLYHQECHKPGVTEDSFDNWVCNNCQEASKKIKLLSEKPPSPPRPPTPPVVVSSTTSKSSSKSTSSSHRHSSSSSSSHKSASSKSSDKHKSGSSSKSSSSSSGSSSKVTSTSSNTSSNNSSRTTLPPNINIISADKRIQIMKKKAATKLQEKRKLPR